MIVLASVLALAWFGSAGSHASGGGVSGGSRLLYSSDWTGQSEIFAVDPSGRAPLGELTFGREPAPAFGCDSVACGFVAPVASPDGRWLLYRGIGSKRWPGVVQPGAPLWLAPVDGGFPRLVAPGAGIEVAWAPDSTRFVYTGPDGVHVVQARGLRDRLGYRSASCGCAWSPDGSSLAFFAGSRGLWCCVTVAPGRWAPSVRRAVVCSPGLPTVGGSRPGRVRLTRPCIRACRLPVCRWSRRTGRS